MAIQNFSPLQLNSTLSVGVDDTGHDVKFFGATSGASFLYDESEDGVVITHPTDDAGLEVYTISTGVPSVAQFKVGRSASQYWGVLVGDRTAQLIHRQDETDGNPMNTSFELWGGGSGNDNWVWRHGTNSGGGLATVMTLDKAGQLTVTGEIEGGSLDINGVANISGNVTITGGSDIFLADNGKTHYGASNDLEVFHDGSNSYVTAKGTGDLIIEQKTADKDIILKSDDGSGGETAYLTLDGSAGNMKAFKTMRFSDNAKVELGDSGDLQLLHDGSGSYIVNTVGNMIIANNADDGDIYFQSDDGSGGSETYFFLDGSAGGAAPITKFPDGARLQFGSGGDSTMTHDGSNFTISTVTGDFRIKCDTDDGDVKLQCDNGSGGVADYLVLDGGDKTLIASVPLVLEADSTVGWHGSVTRVKILPRDFQADNGGRPAMTVVGTNEAHLASNSSGKLFASVPIPTGFKATHVKIHGSDTGQTFTVKEANIANKTTVTKGTATALETEKAITNVDSSTTNYILIEVSSDGTTDEIHGGYMTIAKI